MPDTIVIVDDSRSSLAHMQALVGLLPDCRPVAFRDSAEALEWCRDFAADLILVDYDMPHPDGIAFITLYREDPRVAEVPVVMVTASDRRDVRHRALQHGATDFLRKPVDEIEFLARMRNLLKLHRIHRSISDRALGLADEVERATRAVREREREAILVLSRAAENRDPETGDHLLRMATYSRLIAEGLGLSRDIADLIFAAAPMHDVGKIGIPDRILLKPGRLDPEEMAVMRQHTTIGHRILSAGSSELLRMAADIALCHHERFDGDGYPRGLRGEAIPLAGRIVALADVFDALTSVRPYKQAWRLEEAAEHVCANRGRHFDPRCVAVMMARWDAVCAAANAYRTAERPARGADAPPPAHGRLALRSRTGVPGC